MSQHLTGRAARSLAMIFCATALVACGGGDDPVAAPNPNPNPDPQPVLDFAFATPSSATATTESGVISTYAFAETGNQQTTGTAQFADGAVSYSASLASNQNFAGVALRATAPSDTAVDASSYTKLKIQLKSATDGTLTIKLQPNPVSGDGCVPARSAIVNSTMQELVIDLDSASFALPGHCGSGPSLATVKAGFYAVDVINESTSAGNHDLSIGAIKLAQ